MSKDSFVKNSILLTITNLATGIFKFVFAIYLSRTIGAEGMGLYGLILPIYDLFCCLICGGLMTSISRETANYVGKKQMLNIKKTISASLKFDFIWSILIVIIVFSSSNFISTYILKDSRALYSLWLICPAVVFVGLSSIVKGYFYGTSTATIPAIIDIGEKVVRIFALILLIEGFAIKDITSGVTITYASLAIGEFVSFIFLYIFYRKKSKNIQTTNLTYKPESSPQMLYNTLAIAFPLCINGFLTTAIATVSKLVIPGRLISAGLSHSEALELIGKFSEMAMTVISFPMIIIMSVSLILIPDLSQSISEGKTYSAENRVKSVLMLSFILGLCTMVLGMTCPASLGQLFFQRSDLNEFIFIASFSAPIIFLAMASTSILNGLGRQGLVLKNSIISAILQLILCFVLTGIPVLNIYGYALGMMISGVVWFIMNMKGINEELYLEFNYGELCVYLCITIFTYYVLRLLTLTISSTFFLKDVILILVGICLFSLTSFISSKIMKS